MNASDYRQTLGALYQRVGRPKLEGRFVAVLLASDGPVTLSDAARELGVAKSALSRLANAMLERGDLKRTGVFTTREHAYHLVDDAFIRDLSERRDVSRQIAGATVWHADAIGARDSPERRKLRHHAMLHQKAALALDSLLEPQEQLHERDLERHERSDWDAIGPGETTRKD